MKKVHLMFHSPVERIPPVSAKFGKVNGSATVEALLILPVVFMFVLAFIWILDIIRIHSTIGGILNESGNELVGISYVFGKSGEDVSTVIGVAGSLAYSEGYLRKRIEEDSVYEDISDLSVEMSKVGLDDEISLMAYYRVSPKIKIPGYDGMLLTNRFYSKCYTGYNRETENKEYVYITKGSEVYHTSLDCVGLKTTVQTVMFSEIEKKRNKDGSKYYACGKCAKDKAAGNVYVTPYGNKYHLNANCPNLSIHVYKVPIKEAEGRRKCFYCK